MYSKSTASLGLGSQSVQALSEGDENYKCTPLRLIKRQKVFNPKRPYVEATLLQRAVFYQYQVNSPSKSQFQGIKPHLVANWMLVALCANLTLGALGTYYMQMFLGVFATEQHLYVSKMVPFAVGINIVYFYSAVLDLSRFVDLSIAFLDYFIFGVWNRSPWNRCNAFNVTVPTEIVNGKFISFKCLELDDFRDFLLENPSRYRELPFGDYSCYAFKTTDYCLQLPQISYMEYRNIYMRESKLVLSIYFIAVWGGCILAQKQIYRKIIWKVLFYANIALCSIYFIIALHIISFPDTTPHVCDQEDANDSFKEPVWELIQLMSACFMFSPPMIHFLSARTRKINPAQESFIMTLSTVGHTMFYIFANFLVYDYVITRMGGLELESLFISTVSYMNIFYWFIYFGTLDAGNFFCLTFLIVNFILEYTAMIISFNCFLEIYAVEYRWTKRWFMTILITVISFVNYEVLTEERYIIQFIIRIIIMILETILIHGIYPLRRFLDDITFFYGEAPSKMRYFTIIISLSVEVILLMVVVSYDGYDSIISVTSENFNRKAIYVTLIVFVLVPMLAGIAFIALKYIIIKQRPWYVLFIPLDEWGPPEFIPRQLRKQFDSTKYTAVHAPRVLSRYLMRNAEPDIYKLNIVYEFSNLWRAIKSKKALFRTIMFDINLRQ